MPKTEKLRERVSVALYDAVMVSLYHLFDDREKLLEKRAKLRKVTSEIATRDRQLLTGQANTAEAVRTRIDSLTDAYRSILQD